MVIGISLLGVGLLPAAWSAAPGSEAAPAVETVRTGADGVPDLDLLLEHLGERARAYDLVALRFVCIESVRSTGKPGKIKLHDYMYVEAEEQRYRPYRQKHTGRLGRRVAEAAIELGFPDSYSWTLMFSHDRQHLFRFNYVGQEWFSLRLAHILEFNASLPFSSGTTIYQWSGRVWIDAEDYNFLKVEAEPGNQTDRLKLELSAYRQAPRLLIFPLGKRPRGARYEITFLNEYENLSLPDQAEHHEFTLGLDGMEERGDLQVLRYTGYQFFDVGVLHEFLK